MNKIPFEYGSIAENEYFIDRIEDRRDLKTFLGGGINVMLISPRRWGKSSLVKAAMEELKQEQKDVRVCYLDAFKIFSEEEFYNKFASAVLQGVSSTMEKRWADIVKFVQSISPSLTINSDPVNAVEVNLNFKPLKESAEEILNLPEKIAKAKGIHVIVCIDEFQQLANLPDWKSLEGTMRSVWQGQHSTTYCLYGSKRHMMMDIFGNSKNPFYRFGQMMTLKKIAKEYWKPFIHDSFYNYGKSISDDMIERICNAVDMLSAYLVPHFEEDLLQGIHLAAVDAAVHIVPFAYHLRTFYIIVGNVHAAGIGYLSVDDYDFAVVAVENGMYPWELQGLVFEDFDAVGTDFLEMPFSQRLVVG